MKALVTFAVVGLVIYLFEGEFMPGIITPPNPDNYR